MLQGVILISLRTYGVSKEVCTYCTVQPPSAVHVADMGDHDLLCRRAESRLVPHAVHVCM